MPMCSFCPSVSSMTHQRTPSDQPPRQIAFRRRKASASTPLHHALTSQVRPENAEVTWTPSPKIRSIQRARMPQERWSTCAAFGDAILHSSFPWHRSAALNMRLPACRDTVAETARGFAKSRTMILSSNAPTRPQYNQVTKRKCTSMYLFVIGC
jgi:hypothetical protein